MLDDLDNKLLETLQLKGRTKRNELAEEVNLSVPAVSERLKKLEDQGVSSRGSIDPPGGRHSPLCFLVEEDKEDTRRQVDKPCNYNIYIYLKRFPFFGGRQRRHLTATCF